jgi:hypothetical protein
LEAARADGALPEADSKGTLAETDDADGATTPF